MDDLLSRVEWCHTSPLANVLSVLRILRKPLHGFDLLGQANLTRRVYTVLRILFGLSVWATGHFCRIPLGDTINHLNFVTSAKGVFSCSIRGFVSVLILAYSPLPGTTCTGSLAFPSSS